MLSRWGRHLGRRFLELKEASSVRHQAEMRQLLVVAFAALCLVHSNAYMVANPGKFVAGMRTRPAALPSLKCTATPVSPAQGSMTFKYSTIQVKTQKGILSLKPSAAPVSLHAMRVKFPHKVYNKLS
jgi:hypothetical protein